MKSFQERDVGYGKTKVGFRGETATGGAEEFARGRAGCYSAVQEGRVRGRMHSEEK